MYSLGDAAPVNNPGYFDVPIHNDLSNPIREGNYIETSNYQFNNNISNTINNSQNYAIDQTPGLENPSPSLYYEQDANMSGYQYPNNINDIPVQQKKQFYSKQIPPRGYRQFELENFQNKQPPSQPNQMSSQPNQMSSQPNQMSSQPNQMSSQPNQPTMVNTQNQVKPTNRPIQQHRGRHKPQKIIYNNYIPYSRPDNNYYNDYIPRFIPNNYLNIGSIPNIAGFYSNNNYPSVEDDIYNEPDYIQEKEIEVDINENESNDNEINENKDLINENKYKIKKKMKMKTKKKSNLIYLVLFLLLLVILLMLYLIFKNQKRVRF